MRFEISEDEILLPLNFVFLSNKIPEDSGVCVSLQRFIQDDNWADWAKV